MNVVYSREKRREKVLQKQYKRAIKSRQPTIRVRLGPPPSVSPYPLAFSTSLLALLPLTPPVPEDVQPRSILFARASYR